RVVDLIEVDSALWKEEIIENLFDEETTQRILTIPLSSCDQDDHLVWRGDNFEIYSIKSSTKHIFRECRFTEQVLQSMGVTYSTNIENQNWINWLATELPTGDISGPTVQSNAYISEIDSMGIISKGMQEKQETVWQPAEGDSVKALIYNEELGFQRIVVEGNSFSIIKKVVDAIEDESVSAALIKESKARIKNFDYIKFRFVPRMANRAAHGMAQKGKWFDSSMFWIKEAPERVERIPALDRGRMGREERIRRERPEQDYRKQSYQK
ncbi:hypothetical protein Gotur_011935, partial [Gossypium turneri]